MKSTADMELTMQMDNGAMRKVDVVAKGEYKDYSKEALPASVLSNGETKVLYFYASWCPVCKRIDTLLTGWYAGDAKNVATYKINFDDEKALRQKYGVTYQHTFVKIDGEGNVLEINRGPTDDELKVLIQG
jgi:thioredoxin 1